MRLLGTTTALAVAACAALAYASPLPTSSYPTASDIVIAPTPTPTLPAVAVLAEDEPWTFTVIRAVWPEEHVAATKQMYEDMSTTMWLYFFLWLGIPAAVAAYWAYWYMLKELREECKKVLAERERVRRRLKVQVHRERVLANVRQEAPIAAPSAAGDAPPAETHELQPRIQFDEPAKPLPAEPDESPKHGEPSTTPFLESESSADPSKSKSRIWHSKSAASSSTTLPPYRPASIASIETNATLPSYHTVDRLQNRPRRGFRGGIAAIALWFAPRAAGLPISGSSLTSNETTTMPTSTAPTATAHPVARFAAVPTSTVTLASAVNAVYRREIPATITLRGPRTDEIPEGEKNRVIKKTADNATEVTIWTTYTGVPPVATVTMVTTATPGGNIVPYRGWAMEPAEETRHNFKVTVALLVTFVYGPPALILGPLVLGLIFGGILWVFCTWNRKAANSCCADM